MKYWSRILGYFRAETPKIAGALCCMALSIGASVLKPWPVAIIIDHVLGTKPLPAFVQSLSFTTDKPALLLLAAVAIFGLHALQGIFSAGQNYLSIAAGLHGLARVREELFRWMQRLSLAFYQRSSQGDLIYRATWDTYALQTIFQQGLFKFLSAFCTLALMVAVMWQVHRTLTALTLLAFPPLLACMYLFGRKMNRRSLEAHQADSQVSSLVQRNITSLPLVQSYTREEHESAVFSRQVQASRSRRMAQHGVEVIYWLAIAILFGAATALIAWWGGREIIAARLTVGELVIFLSYLGQLYEPLNQLSHVGATVADANAGVHRIFEILDTREQIVEKAQPETLRWTGNAPTAIEFRSVRFGYNPKQPVLPGLSFRIEPGETIGVVGPSGAGKSTLLNLIPRFYDPDSGAVLVHGVDVRELDSKDLRQHIAFVFQESFLLPATIAENIAYGRPNASPDEIERAARLANAHDFIIRLPEQYNTMVGEAAARLSVGEKQRISIARAFLKDAPILLLDEPTSSLDAETESAVVDSLKRLMANRTTLMVAHRFSTLKQVEKIMVLEGGQITEFGPRSDLAASGGYFTRLASLAH